MADTFELSYWTFAQMTKANTLQLPLSGVISVAVASQALYLGGVGTLRVIATGTTRRLGPGAKPGKTSAPPPSTRFKGAVRCEHFDRLGAERGLLLDNLVPADPWVALEALRSLWAGLTLEALRLLQASPLLVRVFRLAYDRLSERLSKRLARPEILDVRQSFRSPL